MMTMMTAMTLAVRGVVNRSMKIESRAAARFLRRSAKHTRKR